MAPPRLLQLVHGYPPEQRAGTEVYAQRVARGLEARGWQVLTVAAHREPGAPLYAQRREPGLLRVVQNRPFRGLAAAESDPILDRILEAEIEKFRPDLIHVQHLLFLSTTFRSPVPMLWTLHDAWGWCPAGGLLLREGRPCSGPSAACVACAGAWGSEPAAAERLIGLAGRLSFVAPPGQLHRLWKMLPVGLRARLPSRPTTLTQAHVDRRQEALRAFAHRCARLLSPSRYLAERAEAAGLGPVQVLPQGVDAPVLPEVPRRYLLFLGTLAPHKNPVLVRDAWKKSGSPLLLRIVGPPGSDLSYLRELEAGQPRPEPPVRDPFPLLRGAQALVLGSIWPENAPMVIREAQAMGTPVIAPDIGGIPELRPSRLYPPGDLDALAACIADAGSLPPPPPPPSFSAHLDALEKHYFSLGAGRPPGRA